MKNKIFHQSQELKKAHIPRALEVLQKAKLIPVAQRPKLTHVWLAEQLGITRSLAFPLLIHLARKKHQCISYPSGVIFWDDLVLTEQQIQALSIPRALSTTVSLWVVVTEETKVLLEQCHIEASINYGLIDVVVNNKIQASGYCVRISSNKERYIRFLKLTGGVWTTKDPVLGNFIFQTSQQKD